MYLHFSGSCIAAQGICKTAQEALDLYGAKRTLDGNGVTNASQKRSATLFTSALALHAAAALKIPLLGYEHVYNISSTSVLLHLPSALCQAKQWLMCLT